MFKYHDEFEIVINSDLLIELKKLNPDVTFEADESEHSVTIDCERQLLKLPKGFYFSDEKTLTNKFNTESTLYTSIIVFEKGTL